MEEKVTEAELKEVREEILKSEESEETKEANIIFDGRQYSIRFPKKFIREADVNIEKDIFLIKLKIPKHPEKPTITTELIRK